MDQGPVALGFGRKPLMFVYEKKLQYPVRIKTPNPKLAAVIISQYGGPDGELGASLRYLSQRYSMPYPELKALLTDIGTALSQCNTVSASPTRLFRFSSCNLSRTNTHFCGNRLRRSSTRLSW